MKSMHLRTKLIIIGVSILVIIGILIFFIFLEDTSGLENEARYLQNESVKLANKMQERALQSTQTSQDEMFLKDSKNNKQILLGTFKNLLDSSENIKFSYLYMPNEDSMIIAKKSDDKQNVLLAKAQKEAVDFHSIEESIKSKKLSYGDLEEFDIKGNKIFGRNIVTPILNEKNEVVALLGTIVNLNQGAKGGNKESKDNYFGKMDDYLDDFSVKKYEFWKYLKGYNFWQEFKGFLCRYCNMFD